MNSAVWIVGILLFALLVSGLTVYFMGPMLQSRTTVVVERPWWNNYRGWWGHYGAGLPGWGGPNYPPRPFPHPKPPKPSPPVGPSQPTPAPAQPPPPNPMP